MASRFFGTGTLAYLGRRIVDLATRARECSGRYWPVTVMKGISGPLIQPSVAYRSCARWDYHWLLIMRWSLVSTFGLSCKEAEKGVAWLSLVHCEMLDYACTAHFFYHGNWLHQKKSLVPCWVLLTSLDQKLVIKFVRPVVTIFLSCKTRKDTCAKGKCSDKHNLCDHINLHWIGWMWAWPQMTSSV